MTPSKTKNYRKTEALKNVLDRLSKRNSGMIANMAGKHLACIRDRQLDSQDAHNFIIELHWQINDSDGKDLGTFEPEIKNIINNYVNDYGKKS